MPINDLSFQVHRKCSVNFISKHCHLSLIKLQNFVVTEFAANKFLSNTSTLASLREKNQYTRMPDRMVHDHYPSAWEMAVQRLL